MNRTLTNNDVIAVSLDRIDSSLSYFCNNADRLCNYIDGWNTQNEKLEDIRLSVDTVATSITEVAERVSTLSDSVEELTAVLTEIKNYLAGGTA